MAMQQRELTDVMRGLSLFGDLAQPELEAASHIFEEQWFSEGDKVLHKGFRGTGFYVVIDGEAEARIGDRSIARLGRGDFFGEISILLGEPPTADVVATSALRCIVLSPTQIEEFLEENPRVMFRMLQAMAAKLRNTVA